MEKGEKVIEKKVEETMQDILEKGEDADKKIDELITELEKN